MRTFVSAALVLAAALAAGVGAASAQTSDSDLADRAAESIRLYPKFSVFDDVNVTVTGRIVTLAGRVTTAQKKTEIGDRVARLDGVRSVANEIGVLPASARDQQLREQVARAIYTHPAFWRYAELANPPIHIVIENQRITLTGEVESRTDSMLAFSLAQVGGASSVTNQLRVRR